MIPITGAISMYDVNVELGNAGTDELSISTALVAMGDSDTPNEMVVMRGYDHDWEGWMQVSSAVYTAATGDLDMTVQNKSTEKSKSGTLYWILYDGGSQQSSGDEPTGSIAASDSTVVTDSAAPNKTPTHITVRFSATAAWQTVNL